jgi:hypothetical protein
MIQRKPMDTCKLVNVWLGENLAHARALGPKPITTRSGAKLECHQVVNMYTGFLFEALPDESHCQQY